MYIGIAIGLAIGVIIAIVLYFVQSSKAERKLSNERKSLTESFDQKLDTLKAYLTTKQEED